MPERTKVFIVDDSKVVLAAARQALEAAGFDVITRNEPIGSTIAIMRAQPDIVLLDVNMPLINGRDIVQALKRRETLNDVRVLLFSSRPEAELRQLAALSGADGFVSKSSSLRQLVSDVSSWRLRKNRSEGSSAPQ